MAVFVNPDTIHRPATSGPNLIAPAAWGDTVNDDINFLASAAGAAILTSETTTSASFDDLATPGPSVSLTTGTFAIVFLSALISNSTTGAESFMGFAVSGATTAGADVFSAVMFGSPVSAARAQVGYHVFKNLTPGVNTFTAKYQVGSGTGTFGNRRITVIPLP